MQPEFAKNLLKECYDKNIHTCIETCGYVNWEVFCKILEFVDLVLYDIKHMDSQTHKRLTGVSNELILHNAEKISERHIPLAITIPLIPGYNTSERNIRKTAEFVKQLKKVHEVHILPYHRLGQTKYERMGKSYGLKNLKSPKEKVVKKIKEILECYELEVYIGG